MTDYYTITISKELAARLADDPEFGNIRTSVPGRVHRQKDGVQWRALCGLNYCYMTAGDCTYPRLVHEIVTCGRCLRIGWNGDDR